ncbi:MAG: hypothetical protein ACE5F1_02740 [Planctomycetota bacterium]
MSKAKVAFLPLSSVTEAIRPRPFQVRVRDLVLAFGTSVRLLVRIRPSSSRFQSLSADSLAPI